MGTYLVTGAAGFIGSKTAERLLERGDAVVGIDNMNDYYDVRLKEERVEALTRFGAFTFRKLDIEDLGALEALAAEYRFDAVVNLAARAGVRYSMDNPFIYMSTNAMGTLNLLDLCRKRGIGKFVLASTSSLYAGQEMPFSETLAVNTPISPYAASKKAAEAMSYSYHYLYGIDVTVVRYFTVYGPSGRPDMSVYRFIKWIEEGTPLEVFGDGSQSRDFTYVDDIAEGTVRALRPLGFEVINLGGSEPHRLDEMIGLVEKYTGKKARIDHKPFHKADIMATWADTGKAERLLGWKATVGLEEGIRRSVEWWRSRK
ncbi:MAG: NAD-dependent epimerase/dehydratase family protein [Acidobacteria bacterium]|nr:NAD-dependent epimerase/dehydratase family protein [Acidobacteriota bacterium]